MSDFTKIKRTSEGRLEFAWRIPPGADHKEDERDGGLRSSDRPLEEFDAKLAALIPHVTRLLELPRDYGENMTVSGVSISYTKEDRRGAVITCLKKLARAAAPLVLNTPYLPEFDMDDPNPCLSMELADAIRELEVEADRYVSGWRQQRDLFSEDRPTETAKAVDALARDPLFVDAVAGLAPRPGSGIDTVTISTGGQSVTLTQEDGKHLLRAARRMRVTK